MYLERLELVDFRSFRSAELRCGPGVRVLVGANAQGKTNLLEAVHYLATGSSHRVAGDGPLLRSGAEVAVIRADAQVSSRRLRVELELRPGGRARARLNGQAQPRFRDAIGQIRSVLFAPEDLGLVHGDPADRRRFLDDLLGQRRPAYLAARQEYERIVRQRNALLRSLRSGARGRAEPDDDSTLATWSAALVQAGATLLAARIAVVRALSAPTESAYGDLVASSPVREASGRVTLSYQLSTGRVVPAFEGSGVPDPAELAAELQDGIAAAAEAERERGLTLVGPHRDELLLALNEFPAKGYASHGEIWSLALALRLASRDVLAEVGPEPVVLLDDVFAELDERRRSRLAARCSTFEQVLVTAAVDEDVPLDGPRHLVHAGTVTADPVGPGDLRDAEDLP